MTDIGTVTNKGYLRSLAEHDEAVDTAWATPEVTSVDEDMTPIGGPDVVR